MNLSEIIKKYRSDNNVSMEELANRCNLSKGYISMLENQSKPSGRTKNITPSIQAIRKLSKGMNIEFDYLLASVENVSFKDDTNNSQWGEYEELDNIYKIDKLKLPILGSIACGDPIYADEDRESYIMLGTEVKADFCLKAKGDSMINARINDGDIVFIRKQDIVNNGEIAAVIIDDEATLKRFYYYKEQNMVVLKPENPKHDEKVLTGNELEKVRVLGKAIAFQSDVE